MEMPSRSDRIFAHTPQDIDAIVILNARSHWMDTTFVYVSEVTRGGYGGCAAVLRRGERPLLVVSAMEEESAHTSKDCDIAAYATVAAQKEILQTALGEPKKIGIHSAGVVKARADELSALFPNAELVDITSAITEARLVKDATEIERIRRACQITNEVAAEIPRFLRRGMTERELAAEIVHAIYRRAAKPAFDTIVCFGVNGSEPHYSPGDSRLADGDMILIDFGSQLQSYCSDITRMYVFGRASQSQRAMFDVVSHAQRVALQETKAGTPGREVHRRCREAIDATEFAGRFIHGTGHSIGLDVHDGPGLSDASDITLAPGMIMTVEPGVSVPGVGGVRIEDTVLVTSNGPEILTGVTKELVEVGTA
jgi:Xaa-Pro dipeptidase